MVAIPRQWISLTIIFLGLAGCDGVQSALAPAGQGAERIAELFWWMVGGAAVVWLSVLALGVYAVRVDSGPSRRRAALLIIGGGAVVPTLVLTVLLVFGLALLPDLVAPAPAGSLRVSVDGEQWWWRIDYDLPTGGTVEVANEIHLPVGEPVEFRLTSNDVIHSFWIPSLGGKVDMIPGRETRLALYPTRTGIFRGVCAEYCGASHAMMAFDVVVEEPEDFQRWLSQQTEPARSPTSVLAERGRDVFLSYGCGACHAVRGTSASGVLGPDLTHVGGRHSLAAGTLPTEREDFQHWVAYTKSIKPEVHMPHFGMLPPDDLRALAAYLNDLK